MPEAPALEPAAAVGAAAARLSAAGIEQPRREASRLWAAVTGRPVALATSDADPAVVFAFETAVGRRAAGEPLAHVTGTTGFRHLDIATDARALIPRPETEGLVELVLARARGGRIADIGTGTGCIALSLAAEGGCAVVAIDRSAAALDRKSVV